MPVPLFFWKLLFDADDKTNNIVYIGLNNPYAQIKDIERELPCKDPVKCEDIEPSTDFSAVVDVDYANKGYIMCCTKESFEEVYGELDPIVFE